MSNPFIVFEGIDGSGTSTQAELLKNYFCKNQMSAVLTSEPSNGPIGQLIKSAMNHRLILTSNKENFDKQMAYLFAADRHDHLYNEIDGVFKLLEGNVVISTRYYFSSYAYHCSKYSDFDFVAKLNEKFPKPDLLIYIDVPVEVAIKRLNTRPAMEKYENMNKLTIVKNNYDIILKQYQDDYLKVDGEKCPEEISNEIINYLRKESIICA